jgi:hypothetical protein
MFSGRLTQAELETECRLIAESLVNGGVNFLAIDFDRTFISAHTGGRVSELMLSAGYIWFLVVFRPTPMFSAPLLCECCCPVMCVQCLIC